MRSRPPGVLAPALLALSLTLAACGSDGDDTGSDTAGDPASPSAEGSEPAAPAEGEVACAYAPDGTDAGATLPPATAETEGTETVTMTTSIGELVLELDATQAPCTVSSFVSLAEQGFFDGTTCHRLTTQGIYVLQCGDPTATGTGGPGYTIPDEFPAAPDYGPGKLAMANTGQPASGGSQFFIVYDGPQEQLPPQYTVFGEVVEGIDLVAEAASEGTVEGSPDGTPAVPVDIETATVS